MKILDRDFKHGHVRVVPESLEDLWTLNNIIRKNDIVHARTTREVRLGDRYERPEKGKRISVTLGVRVERVFWDRNLNRLRIHGIVCDAPEDVGAMGSHHTLNITLNTPLTITKERWPDYYIEQLEKAASREAAPIIIISIDDEGYCIAVLRGFGIDTVTEERISLPGKHLEDERMRISNEMFKSASRALEDIVKTLDGSIIILGLGFIKNYFLRFLKENSPGLYERIVDVKSVNSTGKAGIYEAMRSGILTKTLKHARIIEESEAVEEVLKRIGMGRSDVTYGLNEVLRASSLGAIEEVLLVDELIRESSEEELNTLEKLTLEVEEKGGRVKIISVEHEAGVKLKSLGGVAALLRFPIR